MGLDPKINCYLNKQKNYADLFIKYDLLSILNYHNKQGIHTSLST